MSTSIKCIGLVIKQNMPEANEFALQIADHIKKEKLKVAFAMESKDICDLAMGSACQTKEDLIKKSDIILVLGGDGTFISVARLMIGRSIPILGINMGQLGFLTEVKKSEIFEALEQVIQNKLPISKRTLLECTLVRNKKTLQKIPVVNDIVISKGEIARIFDMQVSVNESLVSHIKADGLILSTPTGSTAYCLAAGGPIIEPTLPVVAMLPICPHSLTLRPLILPDQATIQVIPHFRSGSVILTLDGQTSINLNSGDQICVTKFKKHSLQILHWPKRDYFALLREKLKYGYRD